MGANVHTQVEDCEAAPLHDEVISLSTLGVRSFVDTSGIRWYLQIEGPFVALLAEGG